MQSWYWLIVALVLGAALRLTGLADSPPGPNPDERSNAIDARSIGESGSDRYGEPFPLYLRGYDDNREAPYTYLAIPLIGFFPAWIALRIVSAAIGIVTIAVVYATTRRIVGPAAACWSALFLATDPQHVLWSRLGMEVILVPLGVALIFLAASVVDRYPRFSLLAMACSTLLTIYSGMMGKPAALITAVSLLFSRSIWQTIRLRPGTAAIALVLLGIGTTPAVKQIALGGTSRFEQIRIAETEPIPFLMTAAKHAVTYWSPSYLIWPGSDGLPDLPWASKMGYAEWACLMLGIVAILIRPRDRWHATLLVFTLLAVLPASVTNTIAPSRILFALPVLSVLMGKGADGLASLTGRRFTPFVLGGLILVTTAQEAIDLSSHVRTHLGEFFWQDEWTMIEELAKQDGPRKLADASIPFVAETIMEVTTCPVAEVQEATTRLTRGEQATVNGITVTGGWSASLLPPGTLLVTWAKRPTPGFESIAEAGRFKIVRRQ